MTMLLYSALLFFAIVGTVVALGYYYWLRPAKALDSLETAAAPFTDVPKPASAVHDSRFTTILQWVGEKAPKSPQEAKLTQRLLFSAGYRSDRSLAVYSGVRLIVITAFALLAYLAATAFGFAVIWRVLGAAAAGWVGTMLPGFVLDSMIFRYRDRLRMSLPDALDLLVVCVESGLGLDQAIQTVSSELAISHPEISKELSLVFLEMRAGADRSTALRNLADRSGEPELKKLIAVLIQTDRFGTSLADSLRTHSEFMRVRRRNEAEERAGKIGVKLTLPTMLCMMPSIMIVTAGPVVVKIAKELLPAMRGIGN